MFDISQLMPLSDPDNTVVLPQSFDIWSPLNECDSVDPSNYVTNDKLNDELSKKANTQHSHALNDVDGLQVELGKIPSITYGTVDLNPGVSALDTGKLYLVFE